MSLPVSLLKDVIIVVLLIVICFKVFEIVYKSVKKLKGDKLDFKEL